jgi:hypothetical protein
MIARAGNMASMTIQCRVRRIELINAIEEPLPENARMRTLVLSAQRIACPLTPESAAGKKKGFSLEHIAPQMDAQRRARLACAHLATRICRQILAKQLTHFIRKISPEAKGDGVCSPGGNARTDPACGCPNDCGRQPQME